MDLATGYWKSATLSAAVELNVLGAILGGAQTVTDITGKTGGRGYRREGRLLSYRYGKTPGCPYGAGPFG